MIATRSTHKLAELQALIGLPRTDLVSLDDIGAQGTPDEDADTFEANAVHKARFYAARSRLPTLADDSGLEVDALDGAPGVRSHRYAGESATDEQNNEKLLRALDGLPSQRRAARYRCALALVEDLRREPVVRVGALEGRISTSPRGTGGFGYDPIFEPETEPVGGRTVGLFSSEEKNQVSHRARAARQMAEYLRDLGY